MIIEVQQQFRAVERTAKPRYRRLPRGPSGLTREEIARNQRARMYGGIVDSTVRQGYEATTVADVIRCAGVSRRAFYEHFRDKQDCLSAAHNSIVWHARSEMIAALDTEREWANRLYAGCKSLFDGIRRHPKGAHLVLVDSLGVTPDAGARMRLTNLVFERLLYAALHFGRARGDLPQLAPSAIVGGVRQVVFARVRDDREDELDQLADEVLDWIESYRSKRDHFPDLRRDTGAPPRQQPASFLQSEDPRTRILAATVRLTEELGYAHLTDSQLARSARLSTQTLHRHFPNKEACYLAVVDAFIAETLDSARAQTLSVESWPAAVHGAIKTYVNYLAAHEGLVRLTFGGVFDVGPAVARQMTKPVEQLVSFLTQIGPSPLRARLVAREAVAGAIWSTIFTHTARGSISQPSALADQLTFIVLAPYIGPAAAAQELLIDRSRDGTEPR